MRLRASPEQIASDLLERFDTYNDALRYGECMVRNLVSRKVWAYLALWDEAVEILRSMNPHRSLITRREKNFPTLLDTPTKPATILSR